jgi:hypothetical protein
MPDYNEGLPPIIDLDQPARVGVWAAQRFAGKEKPPRRTGAAPREEIKDAGWKRHPCGKRGGRRAARKRGILASRFPTI